MSNKQNILQDLYQNPESIAAFSGVKKLYNAARKISQDINLKDVKNFLQEQESYTLHKLSRKKFHTRKVIAAKPGIIISLDLIDMSNLSKYNNGVRFLMYFIDVFSRKVTVFTLKDKSKKSMLEGFKKMFSLGKNENYRKILSDYEASLYSRDVQKYLSSLNIQVYGSFSLERKNSIAESNLKYLKHKIYKYLTHFNTNKYINILDKLVSSINNSNHSSFKNKYLTPNLLHQVKQSQFLNEQFSKMYSIKQRVNPYNAQYLKIGDDVRIPSSGRTQNIFFKGYKPSNTEEIFRINSIDKTQSPYLYKLKDFKNEEIIGSFYAPELTPTKLKDVYPIKILRKRVNKNNGKVSYLVTYLNWPQQYNEWLMESQIFDNNEKKKK